MGNETRPSNEGLGQEARVCAHAICMFFFPPLTWYFFSSSRTASKVSLFFSVFTPDFFSFTFFIVSQRAQILFIDAFSLKQEASRCTTIFTYLKSQLD